jgi:Phage capsid family
LQNASSPAAQAIVGASVAADIARAIDRAWLASSTPKASDGLGSLTGSGAVEIDVDGVYENVDCFSDAISEAEAVDATITAFCADASTVKALRKLKTFSGSTESNEPLLQGQTGDATTGFRNRILGVLIYSLPSGTIGQPRRATPLGRGAGPLARWLMPAPLRPLPTRARRSR